MWPRFFGSVIESLCQGREIDSGSIPANSAPRKLLHAIRYTRRRHISFHEGHRSEQNQEIGCIEECRFGEVIRRVFEDFSDDLIQMFAKGDEVIILFGLLCLIITCNLRFAPIAEASI